MAHSARHLEPDLCFGDRCLDVARTAPFEMVISLDIYPAPTCARVVANDGCAAPMPSRDPEEACQQATDAGLVVHRACR
jgi:hypothetical protein